MLYPKSNMSIIPQKNPIKLMKHNFTIRKMDTFSSLGPLLDKIIRETTQFALFPDRG